MKHIKLIKRVCEIILFFLSVNLIRISFSEQLNAIDNISLLICAVIIIIYISLIERKKI